MQPATAPQDLLVWSDPGGNSYSINPALMNLTNCTNFLDGSIVSVVWPRCGQMDGTDIRSLVVNQVQLDLSSSCTTF